MTFDHKGRRWKMLHAALLLAAGAALPLQALPAGGVFNVNSDDDLREDGFDARHRNLREAIEAANAAAAADKTARRSAAHSFSAVAEEVLS